NLEQEATRRFVRKGRGRAAGGGRSGWGVWEAADRGKRAAGRRAAEGGGGGGGGGDQRVVLKLKPSLAPLKAAVFPLVNKDGMPELARRIYDDLRRHFNVFYDDGGSIGRRYRRQDEAGTPFGVTIDGQSTQDQTVTVRDRDTLKHDRIATTSLVSYLTQKLGV